MVHEFQREEDGEGKNKTHSLQGHVHLFFSMKTKTKNAPGTKERQDTTEIYNTNLTLVN
jgi:hypothetical protein